MRKPTNLPEAVGGLLGTLFFLVILSYMGILIFVTDEYFKAMALGICGLYAEAWNRRISG